MKSYIYPVLLAFLCVAKYTNGQYASRQWNSVTDFTADQESYKKEIENSLKMRHGSDSASFCYDISSYMISVDPFGVAYDSARFISPKFVGEEVPPESLSKDSIVFRSQRILPGSEKTAIYNNGNTLVLLFETSFPLHIWKALGII